MWRIFAFLNSIQYMFNCFQSKNKTFTQLKTLKTFLFKNWTFPFNSISFQEINFPASPRQTICKTRNTSRHIRQSFSQATSQKPRNQEIMIAVFDNANKRINPRINTTKYWRLELFLLVIFRVCKKAGKMSSSVMRLKCLKNLVNCLNQFVLLS